MTAMSNAPVTADHIVQLGKAFRASKALFSAVELGVFSALAKGPRDLEALRIEVGVSERGARDFFDSLVALKLLERDGAGRYRNTPEADLYLDRDKPTYIGGELDHFNKRGYPHWHSLTAALKTGKPQSVASAGNYFLDVYSDQSVLETYTEGMTGRSAARRTGHRREIPVAPISNGCRYRHVARRPAGRNRPRPRAHHRRRLRPAARAPALRALCGKARLIGAPALSRRGFPARPVACCGRTDHRPRAPQLGPRDQDDAAAKGLRCASAGGCLDRL